MPSIESVRTKRGTARFTEDAVQFEESFSGYVQSLYRDYRQSGNWWQSGVFVGYVLAFPIGCWWVVSAIRGGDVLSLAVVTGLIAVLKLADRARGFRSPTRIRLDAIENVSATAGTRGLTRPRLVITYTDEGTTYWRRVNLPSLYTDGGETTYERARTAFAERGL
jgi:hypothetical protein